MRSLGRRIVETGARCAADKGADPKITEDVADMRRRMARERPARSRWDVKLAPGGLVDIEFVIQHAILTSAGEAPGAVKPTSLDAVKALAAAGRLAPGEAAILVEGLTFQLHLQQALRIASGDQFEPEAASAGLKAWLANHLGVEGVFGTGGQAGSRFRARWPRCGSGNWARCRRNSLPTAFEPRTQE